MTSTIRLLENILSEIINHKSSISMCYLLLLFLISMYDMHCPCAQYWGYVGNYVEHPLNNH